MKFNKNTIKEIGKQCGVCRSNFSAWLTTFNFEGERENNIKSQVYNYCPACRVFETRIRRK
jgi:hypothetical protein